MPLPYDATVKDLAQVSPRGLLEAFDRPTTLPVSLLNIDLSTVTTSADLVFGLGNPLQEIVHLDFQSSASATKHMDIAVYSALLHRQHLVPVHSTVILLRPQAAHPNLNGVVAYAARPERGKMDFQYELVRLWERAVEDLLAADIGVLPLAPLGKLPAGVELKAGLAEVAQQLIERLDREAPPEKGRRLLTASFVLTGLRVSREVATELFKGARAMRDSDTYMAILEEGMEKGLEKGMETGFEKGRIEEVRRILDRLGRSKLGAPNKKALATLEAITDLDRLESLAERIIKVKTWKELLADR